MTEQPHFFKTLEKKQGAFLREAPWTTSQINLGTVNLFSRKKITENLLEFILHMFEVSGGLNRFAGLQPLFEGINLLDPQNPPGRCGDAFYGNC